MKYSYSELRKLGRRNPNPASSWGTYDPASDWSVPSRLEKEYLTIHLPEVPFRISRDAKFFAIGSCFARGIENALRGAGMKIMSYSPNIQTWETINATVTPQGVMNKYNPGSILKEIEWSADFDSFPRELIVDLDDTQSVDLSLNPTLRWVSSQETLSRHQYLSGQIFSKIWEADVVFITLGLIEVWTDELTGLPLNGTPPPLVMKRYPDRFSVKRLSISEISKDVKAIIETLSSANPDIKFFLTVSPVPLMRTFFTEDVIVANATSKSRLKAVVSEITETYANVVYFPSYEFVLNSPANSAWEKDRRHVRGEMTQHIMQTFVEKYID